MSMDAWIRGQLNISLNMNEHTDLVLLLLTAQFGYESPGMETAAVSWHSEQERKTVHSCWM